MQLLCRMKDSTVLLQKRLIQEGLERDKDTLDTYKVTRHAKAEIQLRHCVF